MILEDYPRRPWKIAGIVAGVVALAIPVLAFYVQVLHAYVASVVVEILQSLIGAH